MMKKILTINLILSMLLFPICFSEDEPYFDKELFIQLAKEERTLKTGLIECINHALKNNSEIKVRRLDTLIAYDDIKIAGSEFEPSLTVGYSLYDSEKESVSRSSSLGYPDIPTYRDINYDASLSGKIVTGTEYTVSFLNKRYKSNSLLQKYNPYYLTNPSVSLTQPLLRDFGILVNRADIIIAKKNKKQSVEGFKAMVMDTVTGTKIAYFTYFYAQDGYSIADLSLARAKDLLDVNKARYEKGLISSVDLLETEAFVAGKEKTLLSAESILKLAEDNLKIITNYVDDPLYWNAKLELTDKPENIKKEVNLIDCLENAFSYRPDYEEAKIDLESRDIKIKVAKNGLLPTLDITGSFGLNSLGKNYNQAIDRLNTDYKDWSVGLEATLPWGGGDRANYDKVKLEKAKALIEFKRLEQNIILEIRDRVRAVDIQYRQLGAASLSKEKETQNYQAQKERYDAGQISTHDMLEYQNELTAAELEYTKALIDYNTAIINLDRSEGMTLMRNSILLEEQ